MSHDYKVESRLPKSFSKKWSVLNYLLTGLYINFFADIGFWSYGKIKVHSNLLQKFNFGTEIWKKAGGPFKVSIIKVKIAKIVFGAHFATELNDVTDYKLILLTGIKSQNS